MRVNKLGIQFKDSTTFEQWAQVGASMARADSTLMWCLGDWLRFGEGKAKQWGKMYEDAVESSGYEYGTCKNAAWVAASIPLSLRSDKLSFSHHQAVAGMQGKGQEGYAFWLAAAESHGLSVRELAASLKHGKIMKLDDLKALAEGRKGIFTPTGIHTAFSRALAEATKLKKVDEWPAKQRAVWKAQLRPIVDLYQQL